MQATIFSPTTLPLRPTGLASRSGRKPVRRLIVNARGERNGRDYGGKLVDEDMITLRMRIRDLQMSETSQEPPSNWMEWEKKYYEHYDEDVCAAVGLLQTYLMNIRPSLALGMAILVLSSVPISAGVVLFRAIEMAKAILAGCI